MNRTVRFHHVMIPALIGVTMILGSYEVAAQGATAPEARPGFVPGYLPRESLPNSLTLLPPPPAAGSAAFASDEAVSRQSLKLLDTPRWTQATEDANLRFPPAAGAFSCALGAPITEQGTPAVYRLLQRSLSDAGLATYAAKDHYKRPRPFMVNNAPICTINRREALVDDGSYPSGHASLGWAWALILAEIAPDRTDALLARGMAFGQSRVICNVHWQSDVDEGRVIGAATVARLHADPGFRADLDAAKTELASIRSQNLPPTKDCAAEDAALRLQATP
jgi:acid phosphatase (class A)